MATCEGLLVRLLEAAASATVPAAIEIPADVSFLKA
jgi:hypothetical protein